MLNINHLSQQILIEYPGRFNVHVIINYLKWNNQKLVGLKLTSSFKHITQLGTFLPFISFNQKNCVFSEMSFLICI